MSGTINTVTPSGGMIAAIYGNCPGLISPNVRV